MADATSLYVQPPYQINMGTGREIKETAMAWTIVSLMDLDGIEKDFEVCGTLTSGGSNRHGSDEPPWHDVEDLDIANAQSAAHEEWLIGQYGDYMIERLWETAV